MQTPFKILHPVTAVESKETHGHSWEDETVVENIDLCRDQTIEPIFLKYLPKAGRILEAGCGLGRWVFYLRAKGYDLIGIDLAKAAIETAKRYDPAVPLYFEDVLHTSYPDRSFAAVISLGVVEHFEEGPQKAFAEVHRLLTDDGLFFVSVPYLNLSRALITLRLKKMNWARQEGKGVRYVFEEYRYPKEYFEDLLRKAGFEIVDFVYDELRPPRNIGLYVDYPMFRHSTRKWELNGVGKFFRFLFGTLSPHATAGGILWVCRKV